MPQWKTWQIARPSPSRCRSPTGGVRTCARRPRTSSSRKRWRTSRGTRAPGRQTSPSRVRQAISWSRSATTARAGPHWTVVRGCAGWPIGSRRSAGRSWSTARPGQERGCRPGSRAGSARGRRDPLPPGARRGVHRGRPRGRRPGRGRDGAHGDRRARPSRRRRRRCPDATDAHDRRPRCRDRPSLVDARRRRAGALAVRRDAARDPPDPGRHGRRRLPAEGACRRSRRAHRRRSASGCRRVGHRLGGRGSAARARPGRTGHSTS